MTRGIVTLSPTAAIRDLPCGCGNSIINPCYLLHGEEFILRYFWIVLLLLSAACSPESQVQSEALAQSQPTIATAPVDESGEALVAKVNGQGITRAAFDRALARTQQGVMAADSSALEATVLDLMIEQVLINQAAADANVVISDADVEAEYQANRALVDSDAAWQQWLDDNLFTEVEFRQQIRDSLTAGAMRDRVVGDLPDTAVQIHARHILVSSEAQANDLLAQLQNGADFAQLAQQYSQDITTRDQGGDLGWFIEGELLEPALSQVAFALQDGQIGGPVATRLGYHIVQTLERSEQPLPPEKKVLRQQLQFENWVRGLSFNAIIERYLG